VPYRKLLTDPTILSACFVGFTAYWSLALVLTWIPSYLEQALGFDRISAGKVFARRCRGHPHQHDAELALAAHVAAWRIHARVLFGAVCVGVGGLGLLVPAFVPMPTPYRLVLLTAAATLPNMVFSFGPAILAEITPDAQRSAIVALNVAISTCAGAIAPITMGWFVQAHPGDLAHGYELGFALGGAVMLTGFVMSWLGQHPSARCDGCKANEQRPACRQISGTKKPGKLPGFCTDSLMRCRWPA
jgi:MFS family permease